MSKDSIELTLRIKSFLGSGRSYRQGNSIRIAFPIELVEKYSLRRSGILGEKTKFLFFETDKGILVKAVDKVAEKKLKGVIEFFNLPNLSDDDIRILFSE